MNIGRNDPCPCGSGKKFKNCCINTFGSASLSTDSKQQVTPGSMEQIYDSWIRRGYDLAGQGKSVDACELFLKAWEAIRDLMDPKDRSTARLDQCCKETFFVSNFLQDLEEELHNAGLQDAAFFEKRIAFCREFCECFPDEKALTYHNMRRAIIDSYISLGQYERAKEELDNLIVDFPENPWSYIQYGDFYQFDSAVKDRDKALEYYNHAKQLATDSYDIAAIEERIHDDS